VTDAPDLTLVHHPAPASRNGTLKGKHSWRDFTIGARDLCDKRFPDLKFIIPGLVPEGVTLLVSRPKLGKSWLLMQIGSAVALGNSVLVSEVSESPAGGDVLHLALEDGHRRMQRRMTRYFGALRQNWPARMTIAGAWRRFDQGGIHDLREWCQSVPQPMLIIVDTLKKVRASKKPTQTDYAADYEACEGLIALAHEFPGLAIMVATHDRKAEADDVFDTVSGTLGLTGGVDAIAILKRSAQGITLHVEGRDLPETVEKAVRFDRETGHWSILGEASDLFRSNVRNAVLDVLANAPAGGMAVNEIMMGTGMTRAVADKTLQRMARDGEIERRARGRYALPIAPRDD
jgi:hypothetical protein